MVVMVAATKPITVVIFISSVQFTPLYSILTRLRCERKEVERMQDIYPCYSASTALSTCLIILGWSILPL